MQKLQVQVMKSQFRRAHYLGLASSTRAGRGDPQVTQVEGLEYNLDHQAPARRSRSRSPTATAGGAGYLRHIQEFEVTTQPVIGTDSDGVDA